LYIYINIYLPRYISGVMYIEHLVLMSNCCRGCHTNPFGQHAQKGWPAWSSFV